MDFKLCLSITLSELVGRLSVFSDEISLDLARKCPFSMETSQLESLIASIGACPTIEVISLTIAAGFAPNGNDDWRPILFNNLLMASLMTISCSSGLNFVRLFVMTTD